LNSTQTSAKHDGYTASYSSVDYNPETQWKTPLCLYQQKRSKMLSLEGATMWQHAGQTKFKHEIKHQFFQSNLTYAGLQKQIPLQ